MSFAAAQARANASVFKHLANARATFGGRSFDILFRNAYAAALNGMLESANPQAQALDSDVLGLVQGDTLFVGDTFTGTNYTVANVQPDGTGLTHLVLELA
jgi:hypothetical protein